MSLVITVCHHCASLMMPIGYRQDGLFYPTPTLMIYSCLAKLAIFNISKVCIVSVVWQAGL